MGVKRDRDEPAPDEPSQQESFVNTESSPLRETKFTQLDDSISSTSNHTNRNVTCSLPPHPPQTFPTIQAYEAHVTSAHVNRCKECAANLPSPHFLDLHITENHDPFFAVKRERNERLERSRGSDVPSDEKSKIFACFIPSCPKLCSDWKKRRAHLVDKHGFPRNYDFFVVNTGLDGRVSLLRKGVDEKGHRASSRERRLGGGNDGAEGERDDAASSVTTESARSEFRGMIEAQDGGDRAASAAPTEDHALEGLTSAMKKSTLQSGVPTTISFGRRQKPGLGRN
jgi:hypothetical protein